jgi:hypothetical protein
MDSLVNSNRPLYDTCNAPEAIRVRLLTMEAGSNQVAGTILPEIVPRAERYAAANLSWQMFAFHGSTLN